MLSNQTPCLACMFNCTHSVCKEFQFFVPLVYLQSLPYEWSSTPLFSFLFTAVDNPASFHFAVCNCATVFVSFSWPRKLVHRKVSFLASPHHPEPRGTRKRGPSRPPKIRSALAKPTVRFRIGRAIFYGYRWPPFFGHLGRVWISKPFSFLKRKIKPPKKNSPNSLHLNLFPSLWLRWLIWQHFQHFGNNDFWLRLGLSLNSKTPC